MTKQETQQEALARAVSGQSVANYAPIFQAFIARGIPESEIKPRENVFTFHAWRALGRTVRLGEHGVKIVTFIDCVSKEADEKTGEPRLIAGPGRRSCFTFRRLNRSPCEGSNGPPGSDSPRVHPQG